MNILPSTKSQERTSVGSQVNDVALSALVFSESGLFALALVRIFVGYLWFQQLFWKLPPSFSGLYGYVVNEGKYTFLPGYSFIIQHVFLPNFILLGAGTWVAELLVSLSLLFGVFSRLGALLAVLLAVQLYIGLAVAPGEWYWTYGMLVLLGVVLATIPTGRRLGIDQWLAPRFYSATPKTRIVRMARWFV